MLIRFPCWGIVGQNHTGFLRAQREEGLQKGADCTLFGETGQTKKGPDPGIVWLPPSGVTQDPNPFVIRDTLDASPVLAIGTILR